MLRLTNIERARQGGCAPLAFNAVLATIARAHSQDMAVRHYVEHNTPEGLSPFDRMAQAGYTFRAAAENIAAGQPTAADVVSTWMGDAGHRDNILNCGLTQLGVGVYRLPGSQYGVYWTQDFGTPP